MVITAQRKPVAGATPSTRVVSLDVLRGITIAFMIFVNNSTRYAFPCFHHASWNGWTPADLVFPTFLFLVGASIVFAFESRIAVGIPRPVLVRRIFQRTVLLFILGITVNGFPFFHLATLRIYGVLQRIAFCFLIASLMYLNDRRARSKVIVIVVALLGYWAALRWIPVPGYGLPVRDVPFLDQVGNLTAHVDRMIFPGRLYRISSDPEGLLSMLPSLATALLGTLTAMWLRTRHSRSRKCKGLFIAGLLLLCSGLIWNRSFPINKNLWTSSFVLFAAGVSLLAWATCYWAAEVKSLQAGWTYPWLVFGTNAIAAYMFSELLGTILGVVHTSSGISLQQSLYTHLFAPYLPAPWAAFAYALTFVATCWIFIWMLYRKHIFIKI